MTVIKVWAPKARNVSVQLGTRHREMTAGKHGWWHLADPPLSSGRDYAFIVDGSTPLPDPRSPWQPHGVHGPSRHLDHHVFPWRDGNWQPAPLACAIIYELHVGTFTPEGTFQGVEDRLEYLTDLGITHLELMPVNGFSGTRGWGYDGVNLYAPHEAYGGPDGLKHLVNSCHERGLAVVLDVVYNHFGPEGNYLPHFGPYLTDRHTSPWGPAVNFDGPDSDEVRRFFCDNALMWFRDYHVDALRIDAVHAIIDTSAVHILEQLAAEVGALQADIGRHLSLIAESDLNDPRIVKPQQVGGYGIDAQWSDDFHHALHTALTGEAIGYYRDFGSLTDLAEALENGFVYRGKYSRHRQRRHGRSVDGLSGHRFLGYIQNHDQVGNRASGERLGHLVSPERLRIAAALVFTAPFVPLIFQGEEWAASTPFQYFTDHQDPGLGRAVRNGRSREFSAFGWGDREIPDPQSEETFKRSKLRWEERIDSPHCEILDWYRKCIQLRRSRSSLKDGRMDQVRTSYHEEERWFAMERDNIVVAANLADETRQIPMTQARHWEILLASREGIRLEGRSLYLPTDSVAVLGRP
jgi:maltooligosyltrehalose trehalohydrolase